MGVVMRTVKQSLSRAGVLWVHDLLYREGLHPKEVYEPSLSGKTMPIFKVDVPDDEYDRAKDLIHTYGKDVG